MKVLVKTANLSREEWLHWRRKGIGGSDVSVIAGVNNFRSIYQLWQEKTGEVEIEEAENDYTHFGSILEPIVKQEFMKRTGLKVRAKRMILQSEEYPFMLADLDGVINEDGQMVIFEAKTASAYKESVWEEGVPYEYILQVQHYMAVTGAKKAYVASLVGGNHFYYHTVYRDDVLISKIILMEKKFWERCVLGGIEPAADGSKATTEYINESYSVSNGECIELPYEALDLFKSYDNITQELDILTKKKDEICNKLKWYLKENEEGFVGDRKISWKQVSTTTFDRKRLKEEKPDIYSEYTGKSQHRRLSVA